jgi:hypothetical protein
MQSHRLNVMASYRDLEPRGDTTAIELFIASVRGWEAGLRRFLDKFPDEK